jgi:hypothetical protein
MARRYSLLDAIRENDPEYDPIPAALEAAGVSGAVFAAAESRVYCDGYFSPSQADWEEEDPTRPSMTPAEGLGILAAVADQFEDYVASEFQYFGDPANECGCRGECIGHDVEVCRNDAADIARDRFHYVVEIYGDSPRRFRAEVPARFQLIPAPKIGGAS